MPVPASRRSRSKKRRNASHSALKKQNLFSCAKCSEPILPHHACGFCGTYNGKQIGKGKKSAAAKK